MVFESNFAPYLEQGERLVCYVRASDGPPVRWMQFVTSFKGWNRLYKWRLIGVTDRRLIVLPIGRSWAVNGRPISAPRTEVSVDVRRLLGWTYVEIKVGSQDMFRAYVDPQWERQAHELIGALGGVV